MLNVLLVEDELLVAADLKKKLGQFGYRVPAVAVTGAEAVQKAKVCHPDLILMDIVLKGKEDGIETVARIQKTMDVPVVYITADSQATSVKRALEAGPCGYVLKPFQDEDLRNAIETTLCEHQTGRKLKASETRYGRLFESVQDGILILDAETGRIQDVNPFLADMLKYPRDAFIGKALWNVKAFGGMAASKTDFLERTEKEQLLCKNLRLRTADGRDIDAEFIHCVYEVHGVHPKKVIQYNIRDVTERKRTEEALRYERDFAESLINTAQVVILVLDMEGRIVRFNPYMQEISGYRLDEVRGRDWFDTFIPEENRSRIRKLFRKAVRDIQTRGNVNFIVTKDGHLREIEWYDKTLKNTKGATVGLLSIGQDITERKRTEEEIIKGQKTLRELMIRLHHVQESERKKLSNELHDEIGQALTAMKINLAEIKKGLPVECDESVKERLTETDMLAGTVLDQIHEMSHNLRPPMLDDLGLIPTLRWYTNRYAKRMNVSLKFRAVGFNKRISPESATVLYRIVQEALTNIAKHARATKVCVHLRRRLSLIELLIRDDGKGFDMGKNGNHRIQPGGMGLFGMRERIASLQGHLKIKSEPGGGTTLIVTVPWSEKKDA